MIFKPNPTIPRTTPPHPAFIALFTLYLSCLFSFCNVASVWEKGVVEKNVQDSRRRIWQDAVQVRFGSFSELNLWLLARCRSLWQTLKHPESDLTLAEMLEQEQAHLMPMIVPFDGYVETVGKGRVPAW